VACQRSNSFLGSPSDPQAGGESNVYFDVVATKSIQRCQDMCAERLDCTGFEYEISNTRCELWKYPIGYLEPTSDEIDCYIKEDAIEENAADIPTLEGYEGFANAGCKGPFSGVFGSYYAQAPNADVDYRYMHPGETVSICGLHCSMMWDCKGFEYYELEGFGQCWMWKRDFNTATITGHSCYRRTVF